MILRRIAEAFRRQDWFVVFIEIIIVVIGVYIGIYLGDIQEERKLMQDTNTALQALEDELRSDLERLDEVIAHQNKMLSTLDQTVVLLGQSDINEEQLDDFFIFIFAGNDTFFPNQSAYETMQTSGFLAALPDGELRLQITRLFEREFDRQEFSAALYDNLNQTFAVSMVSQHWDVGNGRFISRNPERVILLRNGAARLLNMGKYYLALLNDIVHPEMLKTLEMIDVYQGEGDAQ